MLQNEKTFRQSVYPLNLPAREVSDIYVMGHGEMRSSSGFSYEKFNVEFNLHVVFAGSGELDIDGRRYEVRAHDVFVLFPGHYTSYHDFSVSPWSYDWFTIKIPAGHPVLAYLSLTPEMPVRHFADDAGIWKIARHWAKIFSGGDYQALMPVSAAWELLGALERERDTPETDLAERIRAVIDSAETAPTVKDLAEMFGVARSTIFRSFKTRYEQSVKDYIDQTRFEHIASMLRHTGYPVGEIARMCGFSSPHYFCRSFRKRFGMSPSIWRERCDGRIV